MFTLYDSNWWGNSNLSNSLTTLPIYCSYILCQRTYMNHGLVLMTKFGDDWLTHSWYFLNHHTNRKLNKQTDKNGNWSNGYLTNLLTTLHNYWSYLLGQRTYRNHGLVLVTKFGDDWLSHSWYFFLNHHTNRQTNKQTDKTVILASNKPTNEKAIIDCRLSQID